MTAPSSPAAERKEKKYWLDDSRNVNLLIGVLVGICVLLVLADLFYHKHVYFSFESLLGFHAWFGFGMCVALVLIARQLRKILMRKEDYYD